MLMLSNRRLRAGGIIFFVGIGFFLGSVIISSALNLPPEDISDYTSGASYGPQAPIGFTDGPIAVGSGTSMDLFAGPKRAQSSATDLLFVLSINPLDFSGTIAFDLLLENTSYTASFVQGDRQTNQDAGFPSNISGIGQGSVSGVKFANAIHFAVKVPWSGGLYQEGEDVGDLTITTPVWPLRIDIFGMKSGSPLTIINNTPNSHAGAVVPEPATMLLFGTGLIGMAFVGRRKFFKK